MRKIVYILLLVSLGINGFFYYKFFLRKPQASASKEDTRREIVVPKEGKDFVMGEMRTFLEGIQMIYKGINENDPAPIIQAGLTSGTAVGKRAPQGLMSYIPQEFRSLGGATHRLFDKIALDAQEHFNADSTRVQLSQQLINCTACHKMFKFTTQEEKKWQEQQKQSR